MNETIIGKMTLDLWKEEFKNLLLTITTREGIVNLIEYLENDTDFFIAPSSSKYHGAYKGGLLEHSLSVYKNLVKLHLMYKNEISIDSIIICGLLHDLCKTNFYCESVHSVKRKNPNGSFAYHPNGKNIWDEEKYYDFNDTFPMGHGEKSVFIIMRFIPLTNEEIAAIRWHMMGYDDSTRGYEGNLALTNALEKYPIISLIHCADLLSISQELK